MKNEIWKFVAGYEGLYEVSNMGRVRSMKRLARNGKPIAERILKTPLNSQKRRLVSLYKNQKSKSFHPYNLVASAFMGVKPYGYIVCHKNGDRTDDRLANLYYGTHKQNTNDRIAHNTMFYGDRVHNAKLTNEQVNEVRSRYKFRCKNNGTMALAKIYGVSPSTISAVMSGQNWSSIQHERQHQAEDTTKGEG